MGVILYELSRFRGRHKHIVGRDEPDLARDGWDGHAASAIVLAGTWEFCDTAGFGGGTWLMTPGFHPELVRGPCSVRRAGSPPGLLPTIGLIVYDRIDYGGDHLHVIGYDVPDLSRHDWGGRLASFQIVSGAWEFFEQADFEGRRQTFRPGNWPRLSGVADATDSGWPDRDVSDTSIGAIRRHRDGIVKPMPTAEMILYEEPDFGGGHCHLINRAVGDLGAEVAGGWGGRVSSLQVLSGTRWQLFSQAEYAGTQVAATSGNYPSLAGLGLSGIGLSSIRTCR